MTKSYYRILYLLLLFLVLYDAVYEYVPYFLMTIIQWAGLVWMALSIPIYFSGRKKYTLFTSSIILLAFMIVSYFIVGAEASTFLKACGFCILVPIPFFVGSIPERSFKNLGGVLALSSIMLFFIMSNRIRAVDELAYGGGYYALVALPLGLFYLREKSTSTQFIFAFVILSLVLYSAKRGDIFACILSVIAYFAIRSQRQKNNRLLNTIIVVLILAIVGAFIFSIFLENSEVFQYRYQQTVEGETNGRDEIYSMLWQFFLNSPMDKQIIGWGFDASQRIIGGSAHNDWLEILLGEGFIGAILFLVMTVSLASLVFNKKHSNETRALLGAVLAIWVVKSVFSMFLFSMPTILLFILVGYILNPHNTL